MEKGKRIQKYNNRAALINAPRKSHPEGETALNRYYWLGERFRKKDSSFQLQINIYTSASVKVSGYKEDKNTMSKRG